MVSARAVGVAAVAGFFEPVRTARPTCRPDHYHIQFINPILNTIGNAVGLSENVNKGWRDKRSKRDVREISIVESFKHCRFIFLTYI